MEYNTRVVRSEAYDTSVIEASMDEESLMYLQTLFRTTVVTTNNPIRSHWTEDWDVATHWMSCSHCKQNIDTSRWDIDGKL